MVIKRSNMKPIYKLLNLLIFVGLFMSCGDDDKITEEFFDNPLVVKASEETVSLEENKNEDTALTFSWNTGSNRGEGTSLSYLFKMDLTENNFENPTETEDLGSNTFSKDFTHRELNELITEKWRKKPNEEVSLTVRIIAKVDGPRFIKPEISEVTVNCIPYAFKTIETDQVFMVGDALPSGETSIKMVQAVENQHLYAYKGILKPGKIKFPLSLDHNCDIISAREADSPLKDGVDMPILLAHEGNPDNYWKIPSEDEYTIVIDVKNMNIIFRSSKTSITPKYQHVYMIGEGVPGGGKDWDINNPMELTQSIANPNIFTFKGTMDFGSPSNAQGRIKFPLQKGGWAVEYLVSKEAKQTVIPNVPMPVYLTFSGEMDNYFNMVSPTNLIILDTDKMNVVFYNVE